MLNPFTKNRTYLISFFGMWLVIFAIHTVIIYYFYELPFLISVADSSIFNFLFAAIGFNLWYVIRFNLRETPNAFDLIINHLIVAVVIIAIWLALSYFSLVYLYEKSTYIQFLNETSMASGNGGLLLSVVYPFLLYDSLL